MTKRNLRLILWLTLPVCAIFIASAVASATLAWPTPAKASGGIACSKDSTTFWGLDNSIHPGEIGFQTSIGCNQAADISVGSCLEVMRFGNWVQVLYGCAGKSKKSVLALTHTLWFSCSQITNIDSATYRGESSYNVPGITPNIDVTTGTHGSRCLGPQVAQSG